LKEEGGKETPQYGNFLMQVQRMCSVIVKEMPVFIEIELKVWHDHSRSV
jgi:hypothetical protein